MTLVEEMEAKKSEFSSRNWNAALDVAIALARKHEAARSVPDEAELVAKLMRAYQDELKAIPADDRDISHAICMQAAFRALRPYLRPSIADWLRKVPVESVARVIAESDNDGEMYLAYMDAAQAALDALIALAEDHVPHARKMVESDGA